MTETNVVEILLIDDASYEKTLRLDNPKSDLTLQQIRNAFATPISEGWLYGRGGVVTTVARANKVITQKISIS